MAAASGTAMIVGPVVRAPINASLPSKINARMPHLSRNKASLRATNALLVKKRAKAKKAIAAAAGKNGATASKNGRTADVALTAATPPEQRPQPEVTHKVPMRLHR